MKISLYFWLALICYTHGEAIIYPLQSTVILPSSITPLQLESSIVLSCGIEAPLYVPSTFWVTPQGTILDETTNDSQYFVTEGQVFQNNQRIYSTILQIGGLSYTDAGNYSCVVDTSTSTEANIRAESTVEVVLLSNLTTEQQVVSSNAGAKHVNLTCEMAFYTPPDENLLWISNNGSTIGPSEKYTITFGDGSQLVAQNGGNRRSPSRISTLTIHNPTHCDTGTYSCVLIGASDFKLINMTLEIPQTNDDLICTVPTATTQYSVSRSTQLHSSSILIPLCLSLLYLNVLTVITVMT